MKLEFNKKQLGAAPEIWLRQAGYGLVPDRSADQLSFARRLARDFYPRFHIYFTSVQNPGGEEIVIFNLHLDQKRPGYEGFSRHNAEYDGEAVEREAQRLQTFLLPDIFI